MKKSTRITMVVIAMLIAIPSLFHYVFYESWLGIIGWGVGLLLLSITNQMNREEFIQKEKGTSLKRKKANNILKNVLWIILGLNMILAGYLFLKGNIKSAILTLEISSFIIFSFWRMP